MNGSTRGHDRIGGDVHGTVRRDDGTAVADASVAIVAGPVAAPDIAQVSDQQGTFRLVDLPLGPWRLRAVAPDAATGEASVLVKANETASVNITVR